MTISEGDFCTVFTANGEQVAVPVSVTELNKPAMLLSAADGERVAVRAEPVESEDDLATKVRAADSVNVGVRVQSAMKDILILRADTVFSRATGLVEIANTYGLTYEAHFGVSGFDPTRFRLIVDVLGHGLDVISAVGGLSRRVLIIGEHTEGATLRERVEFLNDKYSAHTGMSVRVDRFVYDNAFGSLLPDQTRFAPVEGADITDGVSGLYHDASGIVDGGTTISPLIEEPSESWMSRSVVDGTEYIMAADSNFGIADLGDNRYPLPSPGNQFVELIGSPNEQFILNLVNLPVGG